MNEYIEGKYKKLKCNIDRLPIDTKSKEELTNKDFVLKNPVYLIYPELYAPLFREIPGDVIEKLSLAGYIYYKSLLHFDHIIDSFPDDQNNNFKNVFIQQSIYQEEAIKILTTVFPSGDKFWETWNSRKEEYVASIELNNNYSRVNDFDSFVKLADAKSAFGKIAIDSLFQLYKGEVEYKPVQLLEIHSKLHIAGQILDDFSDFKTDYKSGQVNIFILELKNYFQKLGEPEPAADVFYKTLFISGIAEKLMAKCLVYFHWVLEQAQELDLDILKTVTLNGIHSANKIYCNIKTHIHTLKIQIEYKTKRRQSLAQKIIIPNLPGDLGRLVNTMFSHVYDEWENGCGDLQHVVYIPPGNGFDTQEEFHHGDVFSRAIIADILCDVNKLFNNELKLLVDTEVDYILSCELKNYPGGWSYLPSLKEVAADADDLGQILQLLIKSDNHNHLAKCETPLTVLLNDCTLENGGIKTWIIPANSEDKLHKRQEEFNVTKWGAGPDNEVMANILYALYLKDSSAYNNMLHEGCEYLLNKQAPEGYWSSKWYYGNYYGTYVCVRLFSSLQLYERALHRSLKFLLSTQHNKGGWGLMDRCDPLNTSLGIITLLALANHFPNNRNEISKSLNKAKDYLLLQQTNGKLLKAVPFIKPRQYDSFMSKTITSAYVLKASSELMNYNKL